MATVKLSIDGRSLEAEAGTTIREAAMQLGIAIPILCGHPQLHKTANCRVCVVELEGSRTLVPSCSRQVSDGMVIHTDSERVHRSRKMVLELLMTEIDTSAAPELLAYAQFYGANPDRFPTPEHTAKERPPIIDNPFFVRDYAKCMACMRCVLTCGDDIQHTYAIAMMGHGHETTVGAGSATNDLTESPCVFCGNCVGACPTGALMPLTEYEARQAGLVETPALSWSPAAGFGSAKEVG
ncbi:MAG: 2Fe-2S iron-sulfur cluster-binding protein [Mycobacterium leprae]